MTALCLEPTASHEDRDFDILRGAGLAVSVAIILVAPAALAVMAFLAS
ncbi:hypothetical protein [Phenylobacterium immobile]|nr:hypothetical protein [Phenylobacterium immobile]